MKERNFVTTRHNSNKFGSALAAPSVTYPREQSLDKIGCTRKFESNFHFAIWHYLCRYNNLMKRNYMDIFDEFAENEVLFEHWWNFLCYERKIFGETDFIDLWVEAKDMAISVLGSKKALLKFRRRIDLHRSYFTDPFGFNDYDYDAIFCCATTMIIISGKKDEFDDILEEFDKVYHLQENEMAIYAADLINRIEAGEIKKDYDYSKVDGGIKDETITDETETITITKAETETGTAENNETLLERLKPIFYGDEKRAEDYIKKIKNKTKDVEIVRYTAQLVNENTISEMSCRRVLYRILLDHGLYNKTESNWNKVISQHLVKKINKQL